MENILIPTDFSTGSLQPIVRLAEAFPDKQFSIVLFHPFHMPDSIMDLLMLQKAVPAGSLFSDDVRAECRRLKQQYGHTLRSIIFRPVYGNSSAVLRQVLEYNHIDTVLYDEKYAYVKPHNYSADILKTLKKVQVPVLKAGMLRKKSPVKSPVVFTEYVV